MQKILSGGGGSLRNGFRTAFPYTLPVMAGYLFLGIAFGVAMRSQGHAPGLGILMSVVIYGGSLQFALVEPLTRNFAPVMILMLSCMIQARHLFYGLTMLPHYRKTGKALPYLIFSLTDETYSIVCSDMPSGVSAASWYTAVSLLDQIYWVLGTILGTIAGGMLPLSALNGIDFSMTALFTVIVTDQTTNAISRCRRGEIGWDEVLFAPLLGGAGTLLCLLVVGREHFLLVSMMLMLSGFTVRYSWEKGKEARGA